MTELRLSPVVLLRAALISVLFAACAEQKKTANPFGVGTAAEYAVVGPEALLWTRQFGSASAEMAMGVSVQGNGVYVAGVTGGVLAGQSSGGGSDATISKYDVNGNHNWTRQFGTPGYVVLSSR